MSDLNEWTVMFYCGTDNLLAPVVVSQLKAIKDAGFQHNTDVLVHFDPNEIGAPTRIYDVNRSRKKDPRLPNTMIGDGNDPFVRNMNEDNVDPGTIDPSAGPASSAIKEALLRPDTITARDALKNFLGFCRENHRAKHYILILLGHGMVVANDAFLPDDNPVSALTLKDLEAILRDFARRVRDDDKNDFEMLALHSCSMSAIEVAYQLRGIANFMMGSEGISFAGSWPYRQLLKKIFNTIEQAKENARQKAKANEEDQEEAARHPEVEVRTLMESLYNLSLFNATDFMSAGYSTDLALCSLETKAIEDLKIPLQGLVLALKQGMGAELPLANKTPEHKRIKQLILLAHWQSQSYWEENYTDIYDFCRCLSELCDEKIELEEKIKTACVEVKRHLYPESKSLVVRSEHFGSKYQYSHGLSVYFPWSRPIENAGVALKEADKGILEKYKDYAFSVEFGSDSWLSFLESYFDETKRKSRKEEDGTNGSRQSEFDSARESFNPIGPLSGGKPFPVLEGPGKPSPIVGIPCSCPSIKNYPEEEKEIQGRTKLNVRAFSISDGALNAFE
jgi:hypothetical protein